MDLTNSFCQLVEKNLSLYNGVFPPQPDFENWPNEMKKLDTLTSDFLFKMRIKQDYLPYRQMIICELSNNICLKSLSDEIELFVNDRVFSPKLYGMIATLNYMKLAYRWCQIPCIKQLLAETELDLPEEIIFLDNKLEQIFGMNNLPTNMTANANAIYEDGQLKSMKYCFNCADSDVAISEINFFKAFVKVDLFSVPLMKNISAYLVEKKKDYLINIKGIITSIIETFADNIHGGKIEHKHFSQYVQYLGSWGINGHGGMSGTQSFAINLIDFFLGIPKNSVIGKSLKESLSMIEI